MISYGAAYTNFSKHSNYFNFLRTIQPDSYQSASISMFLRYMNWYQVAIVYTEDYYGLGMFEFFRQNTEGQELQILNDDGYMSVPNDYTEETYEALKDRINEVISNIV